MTVIKESKRLFYGKWLYKISLKIFGVGVIRHKGMGVGLLDYLTPSPIDSDVDCSYRPHTLRNRAMRSKRELTSLSLLLSQYDKSTFQYRIEGDIFDVYTNDTDLIKHIEMEFEHCVRLREEPKPENIDLLTSGDNHIIVVEKYPHDVYQYRVDLKPHAISDVDKKKRFVEWCETQKDRIKITDSIADWFIKTDMNWDRRYVLVEDSNTLLLMKLHTPDAVGTVYKYVIADK